MLLDRFTLSRAVSEIVSNECECMFDASLIACSETREKTTERGCSFQAFGI